MEVEMPSKPVKENRHPVISVPIKPRMRPVIKQAASGGNSSVAVVTVPTSLNTAEAAEQLYQLRSRVSLTPDEQWRTLDARDRILRSWGGAGSRLKVGGATIGTCPDMCPEKERLHRQAEHQVMTLETVLESDGELEPAWAVKQYSRSSADQEIPMCYELRPPRVLMNTAEHLRQIADTPRQVSLADWFHFMWDRFRSIRKDITQQALCCADSIRLVEICARFHAHCAARLADLEHTQFDQKLNTDNLTKCLQTLKHMYADVGPHMKPNEAEFRGYIALLNLGDANFWWEIKQLSREIQKSKSIIFALNVFTALDNNNYVKFFRLVRDKATYLQACILLRYFNDVRARALARIVKAYAPRGGYLHPAHNIMNNLAFENIESMKSFIDHYGLRFAKTPEELSIILDRNNFIEDSDPFPMSRAVNLIESKNNTSVGNVICGGKMPPFDSANHQLYSSFSSNGKIKETALLAEDLGYNTMNDTNKDIRLLKAELMKLAGGNISSRVVEKANVPQKTMTGKTLFDSNPRNIPNIFIYPVKQRTEEKQFSFQPAIPVAPAEHLKSANENDFEINLQNSFSFSKPQEMDNAAFLSKNLFFNNIAKSQAVDKGSVFANSNKLNSGDFQNSQNLLKTAPPAKSIFSQAQENITETAAPNNRIFSNANLLPANDAVLGTKNIFAQASNSGLFKSQGTTDTITNLFSKSQDTSKNPSSIFGRFKESTNTNWESEPKAPSPGTLFKSFNQQAPLARPKYNIFRSKNKASTVTDNVFNSRNVLSANACDFNQNITESIDTSYIRQQREEKDRILQESAKKAEMDRITENQKKQEEEKRDYKRLEEQTRKQEEQMKLEDLKRLEEKLDEERLAEEKSNAEEKQKAEEKEKIFREKVESESMNLTIELQNTITVETVRANLTEEIELRDKQVSYAEEVTEEILFKLINELCYLELKAEIFRTNSLTKKWYRVWRRHVIRNYKRRRLFNDTPVWLTDSSPQKEAFFLKRPIESSVLRNLKDIHNGYKFSIKLNEIPPPLRFNIIDIIRVPFLRRADQIQYAYDKCFFWKLTIISTGSLKWIYKKINIEQWVKNAFSDKKEDYISNSLLYVGKESWNKLMNFAISISMMSNITYSSEAFEGSNGILLYVTDTKDIQILEEAIKYKYPYQILPIALIIASEQVCIKVLEDQLCRFKNKDIISDYKLFLIEPINLGESLIMMTKRALKWIAKNYPRPPPLEIDYLKSICQRYLGNEIWCRFKHKDRNLNDLFKLISYYNKAVDKLTEVITNEDLFNYTTFPLEFKQYLNDMSPYPKPYEFIGSNVKNFENVWSIKRIMEKLRLPIPTTSSAPLTGCNLNIKEQVHTYCQQIEWFENPKEVACKVVALLVPSEVVMAGMPYQEFSENYQHYDIKDVLNLIVNEKIKELHTFENRLAVYIKPELENYSFFPWLRNIDPVSIEDEDLKQEDDIYFIIKAKRRKISIDSMDCFMLKDNDCTLFDEFIQKVKSNIKAYNVCETSAIQLEKLLNRTKKKSDALENLLKNSSR